MGIGVKVFFQFLGPAVFVSVAQNVLGDRLVVELGAVVPEFEGASELVRTGTLGF